MKKFYNRLESLNTHMKDFVKNKESINGITLIALVITIIVLLILVGISISMLTGENGLLTKANNARTKTIEGEIKDEIGLAWTSAQTQGIIDELDLNGKAGLMQAELREKDSSATVIVNGNNLNVSYRGYDATINTTNGTIDVGTANITIDRFLVSGTTVEESDIPVPTGFTHVSGTTKNSGYTIKDGNNNEFVWVPVDINQKISLKITSEENITEIKLYDPYGDEINLGNISGNSYENNNITPTVNGGYYLKVTTAGGSKSSVLGVHTLYAIDTWSDYYGSDEYINYAVNEWYSGSTEDFIDSNEFSSIEEYKIKCEAWMKEEGYSEPSDTIDYAGRVTTNGGFYVGKYEATYLAGGALSKPSTSTRIRSNYPLAEGMVWNFISQTDALSIAKTFNTSINSSLLTGAAWDRTLGWLFEAGEKTKSEILIDSTGWGNYKNDSFSETRELVNTGEYEQTNANNIYDLAGNVAEWTTEAYETSFRVYRGGLYIDDEPTFYRGAISPSDSRDTIGFRIALYL